MSYAHAHAQYHSDIHIYGPNSTVGTAYCEFSESKVCLPKIAVQSSEIIVSNEAIRVVSDSRHGPAAGLLHLAYQEIAVAHEALQCCVSAT